MASAGPATGVDGAIRSWTNQLLDLGGRNSLVFYRAQRSGTLDLSTLRAGPIAALLRGETVDVVGLFETAEVRSDVVRRLRRINAKSREYFEEQGVSTLFLAVGLATWTSDRTANAPNAPVLLSPAVLRAKGAAQTQFTLTLYGEMEVNPTLLHVLGAEFGRPIELEDLEDRIEGEIDTPAEIEAAFGVVAAAAAHVPGFAIRPAFTLANFSYAKLPMVKDLEAAGEALRAHELVRALAGDAASIRRIQDRNRAISVPLDGPDRLLPLQEAIVIDADASQSYVVNAVIAGKDLIVKGPPGTGKSQTIANLIASAAAHGKTVLFVAEKRAAIDAVLKRLRDRGLADLTLDMHGISTRKAVAETLARSLQLVSSVPLPPPDPAIAELTDVRARLGSHAASLHAVRAPWGVSVWDARVLCHFAPEEVRSAVRVPRARLDMLDAARFAAARATAAELAGLDPFAERVTESAWRGIAARGAAGADAVQDALEVVARLRQSLPHAYDRLVAEATDTGLPLPATVAGWKGCVAAWADVDSVQRIFGEEFLGSEPGCVAGVRVAELPVVASALDLDVGDEVVPADARHDAALREAWRAQFPALFRDAAPPSATLQPEAVAAFAAFDPELRGFARWRAERFDARYRAARQHIRPLLRVQSTSDEAAAGALSAAIRVACYWVQTGASGLPRVPRPAPGPSFESIYADCLAIKDVLDEAAAREAPGAGTLGGGFEGLTIDRLQEILDRLARERSVAVRMPRIAERLAELDAAGFGEVVAEMSAQHLPAGQILGRLDFVWHRSLLDRLEAEDPALVGFDPVRQTQATEAFASLDAHAMDTHVSWITRVYGQRVVAAMDANREQGQLIAHQASLKRGHLPLRKLFAAAPDVLLAIKPCWAMSPLMVSQWLPPEKRFDLVVFDEASQVLPADAVPAILRGEHLVVAGDDRQLPPTTFFASQSLEADEEALEAEAASTQGFESVLDAVTPVLETATLRWHYRSRDESLIAFSNRYFYDGALTTFPGPNVGGGSGTGGRAGATGAGAIRHVLVHPSKAPANGGPDDESASEEVDEVVRLIFEAAEKRPDESLGVIALGIGQAERISTALAAAVKERRDLDAFFDEQAHEPFFVKNLERVQGDERDAIILSIGYAKTTDGRLLHRFGPLNLEGGERRLNVAVTRARKRMTVVSAFTAADIDPRKGLSKGAERLRDYLAYAEAAGRNEPAPVPTDLSELETEIRDGLAGAGLAAVPRLGKSEHAIDFAIVDPKAPDTYALALELDGPGYAAVPTVRDRDRLRHQQLERLGWRYQRLWTEAWWSDRAAAISAIKAAMTAAIRPVSATPVAPPVAASATTAATPATPGVRGPRPDVPIQKKFSAYTPEQLIGLVDWIESDGVDRSELDVSEELVLDLGVRARLAPIRAAMSQAIWVSRSRRLEGHYRAYPRPDVTRNSFDERGTRALVDWIESDGKLRTVDQVFEELRRELGWRNSGRAGNYMVRQIEQARRETARKW